MKSKYSIKPSVYSVISFSVILFTTPLKADSSQPSKGDIHNQGPIVINNINVFDGIHPRLIKGATVLIDYVRTADTVSGTGATVYGYDVGYFIKEIAQNNAPLKSHYDATKTRLIDGKNKVMMPGLIDTHVHLSWANVTPLLKFANLLNAPGSKLSMGDWLKKDERSPDDSAFVPNAIWSAKEESKLRLYQGFTAVREVGGAAQLITNDIDPQDTLIDPINKKGPKMKVIGEPGPRIWNSGSVISATAGHADLQTDLAAKFKLFKEPDSMSLAEREELVYQLDRFGLRTADGVADVQEAVRNQFVKGANLIKITTGGGVSSPHDPIDVTTFDSNEVKAAVDVANGYNTYVTTHAYEGKTILRDITHGVRMIEHANLLNDAAARLVKRKEKKRDKNNNSLGPWLGISPFFNNEYANPKEGLSAEKQKLTQQGTLKTYMLAKKHNLKNIGWGADVVFEAKGGVKAPDMIAHLPDDLAPLKRWKNAKGQIVDHSYSNFDILKIITKNNGEVLTLSGPRTPYLGANGDYLKKGDIGVLRPGAVADLLIVDGDPLKSLDMFYDVDSKLRLVMKDGIIYKNTIE